MKKLLMAVCSTVFLLGSAPAFSAGDELVWGDTLPKGLDPHVVYDVPMQVFMLNTYDGLYRYTGNPPELTPWLAESHTVSDDGRTWQFKLRTGITFHDGSPLTADDVAYSFQRLLTMGKGPSGALKPVLKAENVSKVDDLTVQFKLDRAYAPFLATMPLVSIVNQDLLKANEKDGDFGAAWLASNEAGSGAYALDAKTYRPQELADLYRNKTHFYGWDDNKKPIDVVRAHPVQETSTRVLALLRGDVHATDGYLPTDQVTRVEKADGVHVRKDESMRDHDHPDEQQARAVRQSELPQMRQSCVPVQGLHQRRAEGPGGAQSRSDSGKPLGRAEGCRRLQLRSPTRPSSIATRPRRKARRSTGSWRSTSSPRSIRRPSRRNCCSRGWPNWASRSSSSLRPGPT